MERAWKLPRIALTLCSEVDDVPGYADNIRSAVMHLCPRRYEDAADRANESQLMFQLERACSPRQRSRILFDHLCDRRARMLLAPNVAGIAARSIRERVIPVSAAERHRVSRFDLEDRQAEVKLVRWRRVSHVSMLVPGIGESVLRVFLSRGIAQGRNIEVIRVQLTVRFGWNVHVVGFGIGVLDQPRLALTEVSRIFLD